MKNWTLKTYLDRFTKASWDEEQIRRDMEGRLISLYYQRALEDKLPPDQLQFMKLLENYLQLEPKGQGAMIHSAERRAGIREPDFSRIRNLPHNKKYKEIEEDYLETVHNLYKVVK